MAFTLIESAQDRWRVVNSPHLVALIRAGSTFVSGKLVESLPFGGCSKITISIEGPRGLRSVLACSG